jgi:hypothetical protein
MEAVLSAHSVNCAANIFQVDAEATDGFTIFAGSTTRSNVVRPRRLPASAAQ